nr:unnamed protein product [Digitaria exilis]
MAPSAVVPCLISRRQAEHAQPSLHRASTVADPVPPPLLHAIPVAWLASPPPVLGPLTPDLPRFSWRSEAYAPWREKA